MKEWVQPFLRTLWDEGILSRECFEDEISNPIFAARRLADLFHTFNFTARLKETLGLTLCNFPLTEFLRIKDMPNLCFFYDADTDLASVQEIFTPYPSVIRVRLSNRCVELRDFALMGLFAHEISHVLLKHYESNGPWRPQGEKEQAADALAISWGFGDEIVAVRSCLKTLI